MNLERIKAGDVFTTNEGGKVVVVCDKKQQALRVKHLDEFGHVAIVQSGNLRRGTVRNPYRPSASGIGYLGSGRHKALIDRKPSRAVTMWRNMLARCYGGHPKWASYVGTTVCTEWHNFQAFADWFDSQPQKDLDGYEIDKDLLSGKSKSYCPENCCLVPSAINMLLNNADAPSRKHDLPTGVVADGNKFRAQVSRAGRRIRFGPFDTPDEASAAYKAEKQAYAKHLAEIHRDAIAIEVYDALMKYEA